MTERFHWQVDDEDDWPQANAPRNRNRRWSLVLFAGLVILGVIYGLYRFGQRRVALREEVIKAEVRAAHSTWVHAVDGRDLELLTMLSMRNDTDWYAAQRRLLLSGRMLDRSVLGMARVADELPAPSVTLSVDLKQAEMHYPEAYDAPQELASAPVVLEQTAYYERKGESWAQRPLTDEEWGAFQQITTPRLEMTFPERDAGIAGRIASDLDRDLGTVCTPDEQATQNRSPFCGTDGRIHIDFVTDPTALLSLADSERPAVSGLEFHLPAPTLVGLPLDTAGYDALYFGYTNRILQAVRQAGNRPLALPAQHVVALCYATTDNRLDLYDYDPASATWTLQQTDRPYSYLHPLPDESGLIMRAGFPGVDLDRLRLALRSGDDEIPLVDAGTAELSASLAAIAKTGDENALVLRYGRGSTGVSNYEVVPLGSCSAAGGCTQSPVNGFPVWAPGGERAILSDVGQLWIGDENAQPQESLGPGYSPFWLSPTLVGYVALGASGDEGADIRIVLRDLEAGQETVVAKAADLMRDAGLDDSGRFRIRYVIASPSDPSLILVGGSPSGGESEAYAILGIRLDGDFQSMADLQATAPEVLLELSGAPDGDPTTFSPTGNPAFTFSDDGRWLVAVRFVDRVFNTWELNLVDLETRQSRKISTNYPPYPALYPYFDWSADGQWLALVDDGYLRLIAPGSDYEQIVPHEFRDCTYTGWVAP